MAVKFLDVIGSSAGLSPPTDLTDGGIGSVDSYLRTDLKTYFEDTTANRRKLGLRWVWFSYTATMDTNWVDVLDLTGPGVMQFLALWMDSGQADADDSDLQIEIDGTVVYGPHTDAFEDGTTNSSDGYILIGECMWDDASAAPLHGGLIFEQIAYKTSFKVQMKSQTSSNLNDFEGIYRGYKT